MLRKLLGLLTACILIVTPLVASALGFGNIKLNSALNEPFDAEIELISATVDDVSGLAVKMASREAFLRAGVDRPSFLASFNLKVKSRADDSFYIHLTSRQAVREPFLNFLLELNWYNGRILREYTVLLDPPGRVVKQPAVIAAPQVTQPEQIVREPKPETAFEPAPIPAPVVVESEIAAEPEPIIAEEPLVEDVLAPVAEEPALPEPAEAIVEPESIQASGEEVLPEPTAVEADDSMLAESVAAAAVAGVAIEESSAFSDDTELFPRIPLTEYQEGGQQDSQLAQSGEPERMAQGELDYGITRKGDNLWTVAKKLQAGDESVSIYQIMMALFENNPEAFVGGSVHRLKIGHVLRIDDPALLLAMSDSEARTAYRVQTEEWEGYQQELAADTDAPQPIIADDFTDTPPSVDEVESSGELAVVAPGGEELTAGEGLAETALNGEVATLKEELRQLRSDAEAMGGTDEMLNSQIKELEIELADMQRAISIQDSELAVVQQMAGKANEAEASEEVVVETGVVAEDTPVTEEDILVAEDVVAGKTAEEVVLDEPAPSMPEPAVSEQAAVAEAELTPEPTLEPALDEPAAELAPEPVPQAPVVEQPAAPVPMPAPSRQEAGLMGMVNGVFAAIAATLTGMLGGDSLLLFVGLPVLLVLVVLMVIVMRRRKQAQGGFQESILTGEPTSVTADQAEGREEESSFLSDFAVSGAGAIQTEDSEVDPITEADVFMAYGRYEAAEERLTEAMESDPSRKELKLKLLELYNATKNQTAFESAAEDFYASLGEDANTDPMWEKVLAMGIGLAPNNPLFTGNVVAPATVKEEEVIAEDPGVNLSDSQVMDIGLETGVFQAEDLAPEKEQTSELDFNLDLGDEAEATEIPVVDSAVDEPVAEGADLDFNLDLDSESASEDAGTESSEQPTAEMDMPDEADQGLDFNLDTGDETATDLQADGNDDNGLDLSLGGATDTTEAESHGMPDLEFSLDTGGSSDTVEVAASDETMVINLDTDAEEDTAIDLNQDDVASLGQSDAADDLNDETLAIDLGDNLDFDAMDSDGEDTAADLTLDVEEASDAADLDLAAGGDEVGTKLDLARAYIDMGDPEGARSILDEVLDEGNDSQKQEAQQLIQQIA